VANASGFGKDAPVSAVAQTAGVGRTNSMTGSAAKVFREFKWGLLTLFLLMVVVVGLVYDGGRKKKGAGDKSKALAEASPDINFDSELAGPPAIPESVNNVPAPQPMPQPGTVPSTNPGAVAERVSPIDYSEPPGVPYAPAPIPSETFTPGRTNMPPSRTGNDGVAAPPASGKTYTVKSGDTLTKISSTLGLGKGGTRALLEANKDVLPDANKLKIGMTLKVPVAAEAPKKAPKIAEMSLERGSADLHQADAKAAERPKPAGGEYEVQSGDTLERIARKIFNDGRRWRDIYEWNRDQLSDPGRLRLGQTLRIKGDALIPEKAPSTRAELEVPAKREANEPIKTARVSTIESSNGENPVEVMSQPVRFSDVP